MRIVGVSMVRNEADIIESFVRHHGTRLDHLVVVDHGSGDRTLEILRALHGEGLPITIAGTAALANQQARVMTQAIRDAARRFAADHVFALDADEFLCGDRAQLEQALASLPMDGVASLRWSTFVPSDDLVSHPLKRMRMRVPADADRYLKVVVGGRLAARDGWVLAPGNHAAFDLAGGRLSPIAAPLLPAPRLAHLPFRSVEQLVVKVVQGWLGTRLQEGQAASATIVNAHWRRLFDHYLAGGRFDATDLRRVAVSTYVDPEQVDALLAQLVDDPLPAPELRYSPTEPPDAARVLAHWAHRLVEQVVAAGPANQAGQMRSSA
jgi:hypothetical protein